MTVRITQFTGSLLFDQAPGFTAQQLMNAFAREGYACEPASHHSDWIGVLRGHSAVYLGHPVAVDHDNHPSYYPAVTQTGIDYDSTYLINPLAAWQDFQRAQHELSFLFKIVQEEGHDMRVWQNGLFTALLGIHQVQPLHALWLDHLHLFIGQTDLAEYLGYRDTTDGTPASQPDPLMFGTLTARDEAGVWQSWTTGLDQFGHPNLHVGAPGLSAIDSLRPLFNVGRMVIAGTHMRPGETMSTGSFFARIEACTFRDEAMLKLIPAKP